MMKAALQTDVNVVEEDTIEQLEEVIAEIGLAIWEAVLGLPLTPTLSSVPLGEEALSSHVHFSGGWRGCLILRGSAAFGRMAAAAMFGKDLGDVSAIDAGDTLSELVNILGGNVKTLLPAGTEIGIPALGDIEPLTTASMFAFECRGEPVVIGLREERSRPGQAGCVPRG